MVEAANPVVTAAELAREQGAELAVGARATEVAVRNLLTVATDRSTVPAGLGLVDTERLRSLAGELEKVRAVERTAREQTRGETGAAVRIAGSVLAAQHQQWQEAWSSLGLTAPPSDAIDQALADLNRPGRRSDHVVDLRDQPRRLVVADPFGGVGPHRRQGLVSLLRQLDPGSLLAVVVRQERRSGQEKL